MFGAGRGREHNTRPGPGPVDPGVFSPPVLSWSSSFFVFFFFFFFFFCTFFSLFPKCSRPLVCGCLRPETGVKSKRAGATNAVSEKELPSQLFICSFLSSFLVPLSSPDPGFHSRITLSRAGVRFGSHASYAVALAVVVAFQSQSLRGRKATAWPKS